MSYKISKPQFKKDFKDFLFSSNFAVVYLLTLSQLIITGMLKVFSKTDAYDDRQMVLYAFMSILVALLFSSVIKVYCFFQMGQKFNLIEDKTSLSFLSRTFADWMVTEVRIQFRVLIGLLLFIVPGVIEALRLSLSLPLVFLDEKRMSDKSFDPIFASRDFLDLKNKHLISLSFVFIVLPLALFAAFNSEASFFQSSAHMIKGLLTSLIFSLTTVFSYLYLIFLYCEFSNLEPKTKGGL